MEKDSGRLEHRRPLPVTEKVDQLQAMLIDQSVKLNGLTALVHQVALMMKGQQAILDEQKKVLQEILAHQVPRGKRSFCYKQGPTQKAAFSEQASL
jgi:hypothetical protein